MGKLYGIDFSVFMNCTVIWLFIYGCFVVVVEVVNLYVTIILLLTSVFTYILVCHLAVPQPTPNILNEVLGSDPRAVKQKDLETKNTNDNYQQEESENVFKVFAHRGAGLDAPENSIAAFRKCHEKGCLAVEFDLVLTADDIPVVFHDSTVDRITNGTGAIQNLTWDELQTYDISVKHPLKEQFVGEKIALFSDVVELCLELNMRMVIDIKEQQPKIVKVVLDIFKSHPQLYRRAMVSAFNPLLIYMIRKQDPTIVCSLAWRPHFYSYSEYNLQTGCKRRYQSFPQHCLAHCMDIISTWFLHNIFYFTIGISAILLHKDTVTQYLATGNSIRSLHFEFLLGRSTISSIIRGTCTSICEVMKGEYMRQPTVEEWKAISDQYEIRANFPHCLGAIDGKHIRIIKPWGSGSEYFNYKKFFSIVLMAVVDSNYYFRYIDVGSFGHEGDSNILTTTKLGKQIYQQALNLPQPVPLPNDLSGQPMPYVFVADEAFAMCENVMRPYPARKLTWQQRVFNYRMSRAWRYVECGFGILANKWHILH